jgi:hypothetical protein
MYASQSPLPSELVAAIETLCEMPARALRDDTHFRLPVTMRIKDADFCTYLARNQSSFLFLPIEDTFATRLILRTTHQAWKLDKLPTIAVCTSKAIAKDLQASTRIESFSAEEFFSALEHARAVTQNFTGKKDYVIGHDRNPRGRLDEVILPAFANLIVYDAEHFAAEQIAALCEPISQVGGRLILCGDQHAVNTAYPGIAALLNRALDDALYKIESATNSYNPEKAWELGNEPEKFTAKDNSSCLSLHSTPWVVAASCTWREGANYVRSIHLSAVEALNTVPAAFAEEWEDFKRLFGDDSPYYPLPSVTAAEWSLKEPPKVGDSVRIKDNAVVSLIGPDERLPMPDMLRHDDTSMDPLATTRPFLVFHANSEESKLFPDEFTLVARIHAENIEHAFCLSQHADTAGRVHPAITTFADNPRPTQIGDVIIDHDVPLRYLGPNQWNPAKTAMDGSNTHQVKGESHGTDYRPEAHEHPTTTRRIKI